MPDKPHRWFSVGCPDYTPEDWARVNAEFDKKYPPRRRRPVAAPPIQPPKDAAPPAVPDGTRGDEGEPGA